MNAQKSLSGFLPAILAVAVVLASMLMRSAVSRSDPVAAIEATAAIDTAPGVTPVTLPAIDRDRFYISQMADLEHYDILFACGPSSILMALADWGLMEATEANRQLLISEEVPGMQVSTLDGHIFPGGQAAVTAVALSHGLNAEAFPGESDWNKVDAALREGKSVIAHGPNHIVYIAGIDAGGNYVVGDPAHPETPRWTQADLNWFLTSSNVPGFSTVWLGTPQPRAVIDEIAAAPQAEPTPPPEATALTAEASLIAGGPPGTQGELEGRYGNMAFASFDTIPEDLKLYYLYWIFKAAQAYDVPPEDILAIHFAEQMGAGFRPLEKRISSAGAVGPGQVTSGYWNGWSQASGCSRDYFYTAPESIANCGGYGADFDGDGMANPFTIADNIAATAIGLMNSGITASLRGAPSHAHLLLNAIGVYGGGPNWAAVPVKVEYANIGVSWMESNWALVRDLEDSLARAP